MKTIDPDSPNEVGKDAGGVVRELGDTDSMGHFIGWIDTDGSCWESVRERDCALTAGRFREAMSDWNRTGGLLGEKPEARKFAERVCVSPDSVEEAVRDAESWFDPDDSFARIVMAAQAAKAAQTAANN
jgi:hypothetical protein